MRALIQSFAAVLNRGARLTHIERRIIDVVGSHLTSPALTIWEQQVKAIYKIQRLPDGVEVDFYMREGEGKGEGRHPFHDSDIETSLYSPRW